MKMFVGLDVAREVHRACAIDGNAAPVLSHAVANDPGQITVLVDEISALEAGEVTVALDLPGGTATLPCAMIAEAGCRLVHTPGLSVNRARRGMRGGGNKSDPRDAATIAELARTRPGLRHVDTGREIDVDIRLLVGRRSEIVRDQTRRPGRLRDLLSSLFPALERRIAVKTRTGLTFPSLHAAPHELRSTRPAGIARKITRSAAHLRGVPQMVEVAIALARAQSMDVPGAQTRARLVREPAAEALAARNARDQSDRDIAELLTDHPDAALIQSIRLNQAVLGIHLRSCRISALANCISFRMRAVRATLAGFPAWIMVWHFCRRSGSYRAATRAGM